MKVHMTGIAGGLGTYLAPVMLKKGWEISGNDVRSPEDAFACGLKGVRYLWKATECLTREDLDGVDIIVNLSATGDRPMGLSSAEYTVHNNTIPTVRLLEICRRLKLKKFVELGSGTSYLGIPEEELPATELTMPRPTNPYSASKYSQDILCLSYHYAYGVPVAIVRSGITFGAGRLAIAPHRFITNALLNQPIVVKGGCQTRTPTHISDIARYVVKVMEAPEDVVVGKVTNAVYPTSIESKGEYSILEMAGIIKDVLGSKSEICESEYESGERIKGRPLREWIISTMADKIGMKPAVDFRTGVTLAAKWIEKKIAAGNPEFYDNSAEPVFAGRPVVIDACFPVI
jgi:nucleoside-diphosphate-sugar epimerase